MPRYNNRCYTQSPMPPCCDNPASVMPTPMPKPIMNHIHSLAVAFVIKQPDNPEVFDVHTALCKGTFYPDLYKPYTGRGCY